MNHILLPQHVRESLIEASKIDLSKLPGDSKERTAAIDEIIRIAKINYPHAFIKGNYRDQRNSTGGPPTSFNEFLRSAQL
jgi:hypothetical protein